MDPRLAGLEQMLDFNTRLFRNCLEGVSDEVARRRPNSETNSVAFLACHVVDAREYMAELLGIQRPTRLHDIQQSYLAVVEQKEEPPLSEVLGAWNSVTSDLHKRFAKLTLEELDKISPRSFPTEDETIFGALVFLVHHDSYHIGQLALTRKFFGVGAIRYGHRALLSKV